MHDNLVPTFTLPTARRYRIATCQGQVVLLDRGLYGLDITTSDNASTLLQFNQEAELLLLQLLLDKYPQGARSEAVLVMHRQVNLEDHRLDKEADRGTNGDC